MRLSADEIDAILKVEADHECPGIGSAKVCVKIVSIADLPTRFGGFQIVGFWNNRDAKEHVAIIHGNPMKQESVLTRLHSECLTGDAVGSLRCDCRDQLETALRRISQEPHGIVLYMRQEGRGIGLLNKLRAYMLQDRGLDTVEANEALGFRDDEREYSIAAHMLMSLGVKSVRLLTNNPRKVNELEHLGVDVSARVPHLIPPNDFNRFYLETKRDRSGHLLEPDADLRSLEQGEPVEVARNGGAGGV